MKQAVLKKPEYQPKQDCATKHEKLPGHLNIQHDDRYVSNTVENNNKYVDDVYQNSGHLIWL